MPCAFKKCLTRAEFCKRRPSILALSPRVINPLNAVASGDAEEMAAVEQEQQEDIIAFQSSVLSAADAEAKAIADLQSLHWEFIITRDARQEWAGMDRPLRSALARIPDP